MLATDLLLLALDDERGTVLSQATMGLDYGLAGAVVMELALRGRVRIDHEAVSTTGPATDDVLLDDALRVIAATPGKTLSHWVWHLSRDMDGLRQRLLDRLVTQGTLEKSNVNPIIEMSRMMEVMRAYQSLSNMMTKADDLRKTAIEKLAETS